MGFYHIDYYYLILVLPAVIISLIAQVNVKSTFSRMGKVCASNGLTGAMAASSVLHHYGLTNVRIEMTGGKLSDHFDPKSNVIRLSSEVYNGNNAAAIGVACHEAGHACQYAESYLPLKLRNGLVSFCNIGSYIGLPIALLGYFLGFESLVIIGLGLYSLIAVFQLITLPVEFDASRRAIAVLDETGILKNGKELNAAKKVLSAAALTYVASLAVTLANLLRFVLIFTGGSGKKKR